MESVLYHLIAFIFNNSMCIVWLAFVSVFMQWSHCVFALSSSVPSAVDPVTKALEYVEEIAKQKDNCSFGPSLDLQYNKERWTGQAEVAVRAANLLTTLSRTGPHMRGVHPDDEDLLYSIVLANVQNHHDVFGSAIAFKTNFYRDYRLFCPYAFRAPDFITAKDLSIGYNYTVEETDWFHIPYLSFRNYTFGLTSTSTSRSSDTVLSVGPTASCTNCNHSYSPDMLKPDMNSTQIPTSRGSFAEISTPDTSSASVYALSNATGTFPPSTTNITTQEVYHTTTDPTEDIAVDVYTETTGTFDSLANTALVDRLPDMDTTSAPPKPSDIPILDSMKFVDISDGYWTKPYFDCGGGDVWMVTFSVPFFWSNMDPSVNDPSGLDSFTFAGVTTIDISLDQLDIYQCPSNDTEKSADGEIFDPFVGTHRCKNTTQCLHIPGQGFQRGAYLCECKPGYYFPVDTISHTDDSQSPAFFGRTIEEEYNKKAYGLENKYDSAFDCMPCQVGCDECDDDSPCVIEPNVVLRWCFVAVNVICLILLVGLGIYTYHHREIRVFKAASPGLLYVILLGSGLCYGETLVHVAIPLGVSSCQGLRWFRYVGFCLAYGALLFKTWRITKVFTVRSAKPVRITDNNLFLRIGILLAIFVVFLSAWTFLGPSRVQHNYNRAGLKYYECSQNTWGYAGQAGELLLLAWGMYLCFKVRKAPSSFNESKYISVSIYNEALISIFGGIVSFVLPAELSGPDTLLVINFCRLHATFTVMVALLFVSKIVLFYRTKKNKKKTEVQGRRSQLVFTIDNSSVTIDFSHENPEVSDELSRVRQELVDLKEIAKLVPVDQAIVDRYKLAITSLTNKEPDASVTPSFSSMYRSRSDVTLKERVYESTSAASAPNFLKKGQKTRVNGIADAFMQSLVSTSSAPGLINVSLRSLHKVDEGHIVDDSETARDFAPGENVRGLIRDENAGVREAGQSSTSLNDVSSLERTDVYSAGGSGSVESLADITQVSVHGICNPNTSSTSRSPTKDTDHDRTHPKDGLQTKNTPTLEMFASSVAEKIIQDSINLAKQSSNEIAVSLLQAE